MARRSGSSRPPFSWRGQRSVSLGAIYEQWSRTHVAPWCCSSHGATMSERISRLVRALNSGFVMSLFTDRFCPHLTVLIGLIVAYLLVCSPPD